MCFSTTGDGDAEQLQKQTRRKLEEGWSNLPPDLVGRILSCCRSSGDRVRLAAVCSPWRHTALATDAVVRISHPPWLLLPRDPAATNGSSSSQSQVVYSLSERKLYPVVNPIIDLPQQRGLTIVGGEVEAMRCIGAGSGWMITVSDFSADLQLHNLVTNSVTPLPPLSSFHDIDRAYSKNHDLLGYNFGREAPSSKRRPFRNLENAHYFYNKAVFLPHHSLVFLICDNHRRLAIATTSGGSLGGHHSAASSSWTVCARNEDGFQSILNSSWYKSLYQLQYLPQRAFYDLCDVVCRQGRFYAVSKFGWIMEIDPYSDPPTYRPLLAPPNRPHFRPSLYLVEVEDELLLVKVGWASLYFKEFKNNEFAIYKCTRSLRGNAEEQEEEPAAASPLWAEVKSLGEWVVFIGDNLSVALSTRDVPELTPNCIYFASTDHNMVESRTRRLWDINMGIYHLESGTVEPLPFSLPAGYRHWPPPVWLPHVRSFPLVTRFAKGFHSGG